MSGKCLKKVWKNSTILETRMHSSRMRTGRTLTVFRSLLFLGGGVPAWSWGCTCLVWGGCTCLVWGGVPAWSWGGAPAWSRGGVPAWSQGEVYLPGPGGGTWSGTPPCGQTHACEYINWPKLHFGRCSNWKNHPIRKTTPGVNFDEN